MSNICGIPENLIHQEKFAFEQSDNHLTRIYKCDSVCTAKKINNCYDISYKIIKKYFPLDELIESVLRICSARTLPPRTFFDKNINKNDFIDKFHVCRFGRIIYYGMKFGTYISGGCYRRYYAKERTYVVVLYLSNEHEPVYMYAKFNIRSKFIKNKNGIALSLRRNRFDVYNDLDEEEKDSLQSVPCENAIYKYKDEREFRIFLMSTCSPRQVEKKRILALKRTKLPPDLVKLCYSYDEPHCCSCNNCGCINDRDRGKFYWPRQMEAMGAYEKYVKPRKHKSKKYKNTHGKRRKYFKKKF